MSASHVVPMFASISSRSPISTGAQPNFLLGILFAVGLFLLTAKDTNLKLLCSLRAYFAPEPFTNDARDISERNPLFSNAV